MKRKKIMDTEPRKTKKKGRVFTAQLADGILVINFFEDKKLAVRYCMNTENNEYESYFPREGIWAQRRIADVFGRSAYHSYHDADAVPDQKGDLLLVKSALEIEHNCNVFRIIEDLEYSRNAEMRSRCEDNKRRRIEELMEKVRGMPDGFNEWICRAAGAGDYAFMDKDSGQLICSSCGGWFPRKKEDGKKAVHNENITCPHCKKGMAVKTRTDRVRISTHAMLLQEVDEGQGVARHFSVEITVDAAGTHILADEGIRIMLHRQQADTAGMPKRQRYRYPYKIYYSTDGWRGGSWIPGWSETNSSGIKRHSEFLYPDGIAEALRDTAYEPWEKIFALLARDRRKLWYNNLMAGTNEPNLPGIVEYLYKGRFFKLVEETAERTWVQSGRYFGILDTVHAGTAEDIFKIKDRQKINRIRDRNGGEDIVEWMRLSDRTGKKITDEALDWLVSNSLRPDDIGFIMDRMSPQQAMNYVKKQKETEYPDRTEKQILSQWADYLCMCREAGKDTGDEMVYRPRQLKRRHDGIVEERNRMRIIQSMQENEEERRKAAQELNERFPGAEAALKEAAPKLAYENEQFRIIVPEKLLDIVTEGQALHHCVGSSDRYFDRIMQRETYICFLRRVSEPEVPFYTIEVEPGGTVRQHRSYLDEEPNIEEIRGFLREWQQEVKKRMNKKDREYADMSRKKREENIEELKRKNNLRVLQGLQEDFMEAI